MIGIIDYGAGNLFSVRNALKYLGIESKITSDKKEIENADRLILPGVGAFPDAMKKLRKSGLIETIKEQAQVKPLLGICLGMQLLFEKSYEFNETVGLGLINGYIEKMEPVSFDKKLVIPQMGWNALIKNNETPCPLTDCLRDEEYVYFVHSYAARCDGKNVAHYTDYGGNVPAVVMSGEEYGEKYKIFGCQFHPEKSGETGLKILKRFSEI